MSRTNAILLAFVAATLTLAVGCGGGGSPAVLGGGPTITSVEPASGGMAGGTRLVIRGTDLMNSEPGEYEVLIGGQPVDELDVIDETQIECRSPAGAMGAADVEIVTADGAGTAPDAFMYYPPPTVTSITPDEGTRFGNTPVTITGTGFANNDPGVTICLIALKELADVEVIDDTTITGMTPSSWSEVPKDVKVVNRNGEGLLTAGFTYVGPTPVVYSVDPTEGERSGGTLVTITGDYFTTAGGEISVRFGDGEASAVTRIDDQTLTCITATAASPGFVDVTVGNNNGESSLTDGFYFIPEPFPTAVIPNEGSFDGGEDVTIIGESFTGGGAVTVVFGARSATSIAVVDDNTITCVTPPGAVLGPVDVVVTNANGEGSVPNGFTYLAPDFWWETTFGTASTSLSYSGYTNVSLPNVFPFFGTDYSAVYAVNGGHLDFGGSFNNSYSQAANLFTFAHISAFGQMHNPNSSYKLYYTSHIPGRTIITYDRVPEYSAVGANSFQIHLHQSGIFAILYQACSGHAVQTYCPTLRVCVNPGGTTNTNVDWSSGPQSGTSTSAMSESWTGVSDLSNTWIQFVPNAAGGYDTTFSTVVPTDPN